MSSAHETSTHILSDLLNRYEVMCRGSHPGWHESRGRHENEIGRIRGRIMDVIASNYEDESNLPDVLHVTHGHRIYRVDYIEGRFDLIGTLTVDLSNSFVPAIEM